MDSFIQASQKYRAVLEEYYRLECRRTRRETEIDRVQEILQEAQDDPVLDFLLDEVDHILGHELGLIDEKFIQQQQQKLKSSIDSQWLDHLLDCHVGTSNTMETEPDLPSLEEAQARLKREGLYNGQIDGVFGPITRQAFRGFRRKIRERLEKQGLPKDSIDGILKRDRTVIETVYLAGKKIDLQAVELLNLEARFF